MIKLLGAALIVTGATIAGIIASSNVSARVKVLTDFSQALNIMRSEICECLTPLPDVMEKLSKCCGEPLSGFFYDCMTEMQRKPDVPFSIVWRKYLASENLKLKPQERETLSALGNVLGRYGADEQRIAIGHATRCVESMLSSAENEKAKFGKFYIKIGLICGISMVIVFI